MLRSKVCDDSFAVVCATRSPHFVKVRVQQLLKTLAIAANTRMMKF
jgi:hypothetical protein